MTDKTDKQIARLEAEIAKLKSSQPTAIDNAAAAEWRDRQHQLSEARALRDATSMFTRVQLREMAAACPDPQNIVRDHRGAPLGPSSEGAIPTSQTVSNVRVGGSGWQHLSPLRNGLGQGK
jgi:hypothetical protein